MIIKPFNASYRRTSCTNRQLFSISPSRGREFLLDVLALRFPPEDVYRDVQRLKVASGGQLKAFRHLLDADE